MRYGVNTPVRDEHYDLVSTLYHTLQGLEMMDQYKNDAASAGDEELEMFFQQIQEEDQNRAEHLKEMLSSRLMTEGSEGSDDYADYASQDKEEEWDPRGLGH